MRDKINRLRIGDEVEVFGLGPDQYPFYKNGIEGEVGEIDGTKILVTFRNKENKIEDWAWFDKENLKLSIRCIRERKLNELGI